MADETEPEPAPSRAASSGEPLPDPASALPAPIAPVDPALEAASARRLAPRWPYLLPLLVMGTTLEPLWGGVQAIFGAPLGARAWVFAGGWLLLAGLTIARGRRGPHEDASQGTSLAQDLLRQQGILLILVAVPGWREIHAFWSPPLESTTRLVLLLASGAAFAGSVVSDWLGRPAGRTFLPHIRLGLGELLLLFFLLSLLPAVLGPLIAAPERPSLRTYGIVLAWFLVTGGVGVIKQLQELQHRGIESPRARAGLLVGAFFAITAYVSVGVGGPIAVFGLIAMASEPRAAMAVVRSLWLPCLALAVGLGAVAAHRHCRGGVGLPRAFLLGFEWGSGPRNPRNP